ncbi:hypothetical protein DRW03_20335 [Corallococcus sp. H22C18031201]|nr:hypothetical protein DRW03_20335 [Corallococcus sp. H22C18031201]
MAHIPRRPPPLTLRPTTRREVRPRRNVAGKNGPYVPGQEEDDEEEDLTQDPGMSLGQGGERKRSASEEETFRQLEEGRTRDRQGTSKTEQESGKTGGVGGESSSGSRAAAMARTTTGSQLVAQTDFQPASVNAPMKAAQAQRLGTTSAAMGGMPQAPPASTRAAPRMSPQFVLSTSKPAGTHASQHPPLSAEESAPHTAVGKALAEAAKLVTSFLKEVDGIEPRRNAAGETVLLVKANRSLSQASLKNIPEKVQGFKTVIQLTFAMLPLRRSSAPALPPPVGFVVKKSTPVNNK